MIKWGENMDFFETSVSYDTLTQRLNEVYSKLSVKYNKIVYIICGIWVIIALSIAVALIDNQEKIFFAPIIIGVVFVLITVAISRATLNSKIRNNHLNKEIISLYNFTEGTNVQYEVKPTFDKTFNSRMALFVRHASASFKYKISTDNPSHLNFDLLNTRLVTSSGNSTTLHFDGDYLILDFPTNQQFHIKHKKARTGLKDVKFYKDKDENYNIYLTQEDYDKEEKRVIRPLNRQFISLYNYAKEVFQTEKISIGSNKQQLHIAISEKIKFHVPKQFDYDNVKKYYDEFTQVIRNVIQLISYINDQEFQE